MDTHHQHQPVPITLVVILSCLLYKHSEMVSFAFHLFSGLLETQRPWNVHFQHAQRSGQSMCRPAKKVSAALWNCC